MPHEQRGGQCVHGFVSVAELVAEPAARLPEAHGREHERHFRSRRERFADLEVQGVDVGLSVPCLVALSARRGDDDVRDLGGCEGRDENEEEGDDRSHHCPSNSRSGRGGPSPVSASYTARAVARLRCE